MADKNQSEQHAAERQKELLAQALERARAEDGYLLNQAGKAAPRLYPRESGVSAFNALILALHSDRGGYHTNLYTPYPGAKQRGESVQTGEKGVPFIWYRWNEYRSKTEEGRTITKKEYEQLPAEQKEQYSPIRDRQIRTLFNIEQTTLPLTDPEAFAKAVKEHGTLEDRAPRDDKQTRIDVNLLTAPPGTTSRRASTSTSFSASSARTSSRSARTGPDWRTGTPRRTSSISPPRSTIRTTPRMFRMRSARS